MPPGDPLRVLIVAGDPLARAGLGALLSGREDCIVAGQAPPDGDLPDELQAARPDVVLWDLGWEPSHALGLLSEWAALLPPVAVLMPAASDALDVVAAWSAGASALLARDAGGAQLLAGLQAVHQGLVVLDSRLATGNLFRQPALGDVDGGLVEDLTPRELEVLQLLAEGLSNKSIAFRLGISDHTVKFHVNAIMGKLGAQSRTEAVVRATRQGLILL